PRLRSSSAARGSGSRTQCCQATRGTGETGERLELRCRVTATEWDLGCHLVQVGSTPDTAMQDLKISLPLYEGPLDLLLDLIRRQKLDIYDIPIAKITEQYLAFLHLMEDMNVDVASEFIVIAAQLIYIKSRMLLPPDPDAAPEEQEDPRNELVRRL